MHLLPFAIIWAILAAVVIGLAIARMFIAGKEDDSLHVADSNTAALVEQRQTFQKLDVIDRWGKITTIVAAVTGLALLAAFIYDLWMQGSGYAIK